MFTLEEILKAWETCYGEDMKEDYAGFIDELGKIPPHPIEKTLDILWGFISEKDINAIMQKLKEQNL